MDKADNYDHNYQYDGSFGASTLDLDNGECLANIFTVSGNPGGREQLKAVSFALYTPDVYYSIQVYKNPDPGEPESGTAMFSSKQYGSTTYSGYYTIPLKTQPVFEEGDTFSVVLTFRGKIRPAWTPLWTIPPIQPASSSIPPPPQGRAFIKAAEPGKI
ncbi:MAG: lectin like domain-containing protein [Lachnospiraceae bacterium]